MQMVESHIYIELIYSRLSREEVPSFTKHDSILVKGEFEEVTKAKDIVVDEFEAIGFEGRIMTEWYELTDSSSIQFNDPNYNFIVINPEMYNNNDSV